MPAGMLIIFLEKALSLIHIETHHANPEASACAEAFHLLAPHHCKTTVSKPSAPLSLKELIQRPPKAKDEAEEVKEQKDVEMKDVSASSRLKS